MQTNFIALNGLYQLLGEDRKSYSEPEKSPILYDACVAGDINTIENLLDNLFDSTPDFLENLILSETDDVFYSDIKNKYFQDSQDSLVNNDFNCFFWLIGHADEENSSWIEIIKRLYLLTSARWKEKDFVSLIELAKELEKNEIAQLMQGYKENSKSPEEEKASADKKNQEIENHSIYLKELQSQAIPLCKEILDRYNFWSAQPEFCIERSELLNAYKEVKQEYILSRCNKEQKKVCQMIVAFKTYEELERATASNLELQIFFNSILKEIKTAEPVFFRKQMNYLKFEKKQISLKCIMSPELCKYLENNFNPVFMLLFCNAMLSFLPEVKKEKRRTIDTDDTANSNNPSYFSFWVNQEDKGSVSTATAAACDDDGLESEMKRVKI